MLKRFQLLRNIGRFDNHSGSDATDLATVSLIYGENGQGKTTLSAVMRAALLDDAGVLHSRRRLGGAGDPHVVLVLQDDDAVVFQDGQWSLALSNVWVFDDAFIDDNVYSGLKVEASHRQGLHEIVIGRQGVTLARQFNATASEISELNSRIRRTEQAFSTDDLHGLPPAEFSELEEVDQLEEKIEEARSTCRALESVSTIAETQVFSSFAIPDLDVDSIGAVLARVPADISRAAVEAVAEHFENLSDRAEQWVERGMDLSGRDVSSDCPFCRQSLRDSDIFGSYLEYFGEAYESHLGEIRALKEEVDVDFDGDSLAAVQRRITAERERHGVWSDHLELPAFALELDQVAEVWETMRDMLGTALRDKLSDPLAPLALNLADPRIERYQELETEVSELSEALVAASDRIRELKAETASGDLEAASARLERLLATSVRFNDQNIERCEDLQSALSEKREAEERKKELRVALDEHRASTFPAYQNRINELLEKFGAGFRIREMMATNPGGFPSSTYHIEVNDEEVSSTADDPEAPQFRSILSAGDRTTLAFAFFLASLDQEEDLDGHMIVIDDPISSLDENRMLVTAEEICRIQERVSQVIVLSHSKRLLCAIWKQVDRPTTHLEVRRQGNSSTIAPWDIHEEALTQFDRRHNRLCNYLSDGGAVDFARGVATDLRPILEGYLRVSCAQHFPPGETLGNLVVKARSRLGRDDEIMPEERLQELDNLREYSNRFHHDTNPAYDRALEDLNQVQLESYARRVLAFVTPDRER